MDIKNNTYNFPLDKQYQSYFKYDIFASIVLYCIFPSGLAISAYTIYPYVALLLGAAFLLLLPIFYMYCRWLFFKYDSSTTLSINIISKTFVYQHKEDKLTFHSSDIISWKTQCFGFQYANLLEFTELTLKSGKTIFIHGGLGELNSFLRNQSEVLEMPEEDPCYNILFLIQHIKEIKSRK